MTAVRLSKHCILKSRSKAQHVFSHPWRTKTIRKGTPKMTNSTTITTSPAEQQQSSSGAEVLAESKEKSPDRKLSATDPQHTDNRSEKRPLWRLILTTVALLTGVFLVALDVNILGQYSLRERRECLGTDRHIDSKVTQLLRHRKSRPSFTASKTLPGTQHRTIWPNWPHSQRLADYIHLSPSNGHSVGV